MMISWLTAYGSELLEVQCPRMKSHDRSEKLSIILRGPFHCYKALNHDGGAIKSV